MRPALARGPMPDSEAVPRVTCLRRSVEDVSDPLDELGSSKPHHVQVIAQCRLVVARRVTGRCVLRSGRVVRPPEGVTESAPRLGLIRASPLARPDEPSQCARVLPGVGRGCCGLQPRGGDRSGAAGRRLSCRSSLSGRRNPAAVVQAEHGCGRPKGRPPRGPTGSRGSQGANAEDLVANKARVGPRQVARRGVSWIVKAGAWRGARVGNRRGIVLGNGLGVVGVVGEGVGEGVGGDVG